jgi:hypothetical protein
MRTTREAIRRGLQRVHEVRVDHLREPARSHERVPAVEAQEAADVHAEARDAGDDAIHARGGPLLAAVERKSLDNLTATLSDGTLAFQLRRLAKLPLAAVVVVSR